MKGYATNADCEKCGYCYLRDISSDFQEYIHICRKTGKCIEIDKCNSNNKPCGLPKGQYYKIELKETIQAT